MQYNKLTAGSLLANSNLIFAFPELIHLHGKWLGSHQGDALRRHNREHFSGGERCGASRKRRVERGRSFPGFLSVRFQHSLPNKQPAIFFDRL